VFGAEFARGADGVAPVELRVRPVAEPDFVFEEAALIACFPGPPIAPVRSNCRKALETSTRCHGVRTTLASSPAVRES